MKIFEKMPNGKVLIKNVDGTVIGSYAPNKEVLRHPQGNALVITDDSSPQEVDKGLVIYYDDVEQASCTPVIDVNSIDELIVELGASFFFEEVEENSGGGGATNSTIADVLANGNQMADGQSIQSNDDDVILKMAGAVDNEKFSLESLSARSKLFINNESFIIEKDSADTPDNEIANSQISMNGYTSSIGNKFTDENDSSRNRSGAIGIINVEGYRLLVPGDYLGPYEQDKKESPAIICNGGYAIHFDVYNSVIIGGNRIRAKKSNSAYVNQIAFNKSFSSFDTVLEHETPTQDNVLTLPNKSGTVATTSDVRKMVLIDGFEYTYIAIHNHSAGINGDPNNPENGDLAMNGRMPDGRLANLRKYTDGVWSVEDDNII